MEIQESLRYRVNVGTSVKGIKTWDCTVEMGQEQPVISLESALNSMIDILELSDKLVQELEKRYPIIADVK